MKVHRPLAPYELILLLIFPLTSCVSVHVEPLTHEVYPPKNGPESLQWLEAEPEAPHVKLARISATSQTADEDELREKILARAATLGADAVIMGKSDVLETVGTGSPRNPRWDRPAEAPEAGGLSIMTAGASRKARLIRRNSQSTYPERPYDT